MDNAAKVTHDLVATEEGKRHIEKTIKDASDQVEKTYADILSKVKAEMEKASRPKK
jgi:cell division protein ZapA (FtsZ GTPase activity inhibitor)